MLINEKVESTFEMVSSPKLVPRVPIVIRLDVNNLCKQVKRLSDSDPLFARAMISTTKKLFSRFDCAFAYTCSDEISLLRLDYARPGYASVYDGDVQTYCSMVASAATSYLLRSLNATIEKLKGCQEVDDLEESGLWSGHSDDYIKQWEEIASKDFFFTARVFNLPCSEIALYFKGRQSLHSGTILHRLAHRHEVDNYLPLEDIIKALKEKGIDWEDPAVCASPRGSVIYGVRTELDVPISLNNGRVKTHSFSILAKPAPSFMDTPFIIDTVAAEAEAHGATYYKFQL